MHTNRGGVLWHRTLFGAPKTVLWRSHGVHERTPTQFSQASARAHTQTCTMHNNGGGALRHLTSSGDPKTVLWRWHGVLFCAPQYTDIIPPLFPLKSSSRSLLQIQTNTSSRGLRSPNSQTGSKSKQGGKQKKTKKQSRRCLLTRTP